MDETDGTDETDETDGTDGMDETDGTDGTDGIDGTDGMDGAEVRMRRSIARRLAASLPLLAAVAAAGAALVASCASGGSAGFRAPRGDLGGSAARDGGEAGVDLAPPPPGSDLVAAPPPADLAVPPDLTGCASDDDGKGPIAGGGTVCEPGSFVHETSGSHVSRPSAHSSTSMQVCPSPRYPSGQSPH